MDKTQVKMVSLTHSCFASLRMGTIIVDTVFTVLHVCGLCIVFGKTTWENECYFKFNALLQVFGLVASIFGLYGTLFENQTFIIPMVLVLVVEIVAVFLLSVKIIFKFCESKTFYSLNFYHWGQSTTNIVSKVEHTVIVLLLWVLSYILYNLWKQQYALYESMTETNIRNCNPENGTDLLKGYDYKNTTDSIENIL
ncbi:uncharacterized protein LOC116348030 [Contarinia nasturtii]|uniref:uncharacterized protein LOC116348030 n=1 Tax=Contarinia nasturtii TaxID=265458 RepID=UPI0012D37347|nr:uncharacterized protein LOC116348030 [Contarinia nasturtii]